MKIIHPQAAGTESTQSVSRHRPASPGRSTWTKPVFAPPNPGFSAPGLNCVNSQHREAQSTDMVCSAPGSHTDPQMEVVPAQLSEGGSGDRGDTQDMPHTQQQLQEGLNVDLLV